MQLVFFADVIIRKYHVTQSTAGVAIILNPLLQSRGFPCRLDALYHNRYVSIDGAFNLDLSLNNVSFVISMMRIINFQGIILTQST